MSIELRSMAFTDGQRVPQPYTCDGRDLSPPLEWRGEPPGTMGFALTCVDMDAPRGVFRHWAVYDIPASCHELRPGERGYGEAVNDFGRTGHGGPCPPRGDRPHRYIFRLSALGSPIGPQTAPIRVADIEALARRHEIAAAELTALYGR